MHVKRGPNVFPSTQDDYTVSHLARTGADDTTPWGDRKNLATFTPTANSICFSGTAKVVKTLSKAQADCALSDACDGFTFINTHGSHTANGDVLKKKVDQRNFQDRKMRKNNLV